MKSGKTLSPAEVDFWLDSDKYNNLLDYSSGDQLSFTVDMVKLASIRRAISHFVRILTRQSIPVYFNDANANVNFGGKIIYISATIHSKLDFDVAVGQALHEGAHTLKTDFDVIKSAWANIPSHILKLSDSKNIRRASFEKFLHSMWNIIEDRYIDNYVFKEAPGYRGYYVALYEKFWNCAAIDELLIGDLFRHPSLESYQFRVMNFTNLNTDLLALPNLDVIAKEIDISNIGRLKTTQDRIITAFNVVEIVLNCLDRQPTQSEIPARGGDPGKSGTGKGLANPRDYFDFGEDNDDNSANPSDKPSPDVGKKMMDEISDILGNRNPDPSKLPENNDIVSKISDEELDKEVLRQIDTVNKFQRDFLSGEIPKGKVTEAEKSLLDLIEKHGIVLVRVDMPTITPGDSNSIKVDCIVVQELTKDLIFSGSDVFPLSGTMKVGAGIPDPPQDVYDAVINGIRIGSRLGRKLQIRMDDTPLKTIRKKSGKVNRRQIHSAAFDAEDLFYKIQLNTIPDATLHISVDASTSMAGKKWTSTMTAVVAVCKAASMISNVHVTVSFRATQNSGNTTLPYIVLAYDSKKDNFSKIRALFPFLSPGGCTPEGLAFSATMDLFTGITPDEVDRYLLNLSDGEPFYHMTIPTGETIGYVGEVGVTHTRSQIEKIRRHGVHVLSYFIEDDSGAISAPNPKKNTLQTNFRRMYGNSAKFIGVNDVIDLSKTLNDLFLSRVNEKKY